MPEVTVKFPETKSDPLLKQLLREFEAVQRQLRKQKPQEDSSAKLIAAFTRHQDALLRSMERLVGKVGNNGSGKDDAIIQAMRGMKKALTALPDSLRSAMNGSMKAKQQQLSRPRVTVKPNVTVNLKGMNRRFDRMDDLISAIGKSRNRTFGSNY